MPNKTGKDVSFQIDNASQTIANISSHLNQASLQAALNILQDTALGEGEHTYRPGVAGATVSINGFVNTTTDAIFGPLIGNDTAVTKTVEYGAYSNRYYNGEVFITNVQYSGAVDDLETFSADMTFSGAVTRTSKQLT